MKKEKTTAEAKRWRKNQGSIAFDGEEIVNPTIQDFNRFYYRSRIDLYSQVRILGFRFSFSSENTENKHAKADIHRKEESCEAQKKQ